VAKHVDLATVITGERMPSFMIRGIEKNQTALTLLTVLSIADRSYGERADQLTTYRIQEYFEWGDLSSKRWEQLLPWELELLKTYIHINPQIFLSESLLEGIVTEKDIAVYKDYFGKRIEVIDYGMYIFQYFVQRDASGKNLLKLLVALSKLCADENDNHQAHISWITLTKSPDIFRIMYRAIDQLDVRDSASAIKETLAAHGIQFSVRARVKFDLLYRAVPSQPADHAGTPARELDAGL
jgi:hypothetical protein